ncbi:hypothetical protein GCM10008956_40070 [Deinococcus arenae]|uniref:Uncharacterized protein n=1 Tax=Deinococcus arenae TaxID=1452751 RepID=A0A8H9GW70_9DEIO|nr:hypothetical protein GCM10008956_40070 [Deinococcus arenae]
MKLEWQTLQPAASREGNDPSGRDAAKCTERPSGVGVCGRPLRVPCTLDATVGPDKIDCELGSVRLNSWV